MIIDTGDIRLIDDEFLKDPLKVLPLIVRKKPNAIDATKEADPHPSKFKKTNSSLDAPESGAPSPNPSLEDSTCSPNTYQPATSDPVIHSSNIPCFSQIAHSIESPQNSECTLDSQSTPSTSHYRPASKTTRRSIEEQLHNNSEVKAQISRFYHKRPSFDELLCAPRSVQYMYGEPYLALEDKERNSFHQGPEPMSRQEVIDEFTQRTWCLIKQCNESRESWLTNAVSPLIPLSDQELSEILSQDFSSTDSMMQHDSLVQTSIQTSTQINTQMSTIASTQISMQTSTQTSTQTSMQTSMQTNTQISTQTSSQVNQQLPQVNRTTQSQHPHSRSIQHGTVVIVDCTNSHMEEITMGCNGTTSSCRKMIKRK